VCAAIRASIENGAGEVIDDAMRELNAPLQQLTTEIANRLGFAGVVAPSADSALGQFLASRRALEAEYAEVRKRLQSDVEGEGIAMMLQEVARKPGDCMDVLEALKEAIEKRVSESFEEFRADLVAMRRVAYRACGLVRANWHRERDWVQSQMPAGGEGLIRAADCFFFEGAEVGAFETSIERDDLTAIKKAVDGDLNTLRLTGIPRSMAMKSAASMLDIAAGLGRTQIYNTLVGNGGMTPTEATMDAAIASGSGGVFAQVWQGLDPTERVGHLAHFACVAADFHRLDIFKWLFDRAGPAARKEIAEFVVLSWLGDAVLYVVVQGVDISPFRDALWPDLIPAQDHADE
jgi:hypothetical protein